MMDDKPPTGNNRFFSSTDAEGPDTVRILPENESSWLSSPEEDQWYVEKHPSQHGALLTTSSGATSSAPVSGPSPSPAAKGPQAVPPEPAEAKPDESRALQPYDNRPLQAPAEAKSVTHVHKGPSACAIIAATVAVLLLACALLAFATVKNGFDGISKLAGVFPSIISSPTVTIDTSRPTVLDEVRSLSKLETVHYQLEKVVTGKSSGPLPDFLTSDKILLVAHGEVVAGVDLSKITADDVSVVSNTVSIRLPKAEVLYSKLDNDKTYVYDRQTGIFSHPDPNLETQIRQAAEQDILSTALEDGILDQAGTNAQAVLRTLLTGLGYKQVNFTQGP